MMWYSIDRSKLKFLHKAETLDAIQLLVWIEANACDVIITSFESPGSLPDFTLFELHKLYLNTCGTKWIGFQEAELRKAIAALAQALVPTDYEVVELRRQAERITMKDVLSYRYVKGSNQPAIEEGFERWIKAAAPVPSFEYSGVEPPLFSGEGSGTPAPAEPRQRRSAAAGGQVSPRRKAPATITRPTDGIGAAIWDLLDANEALRDPAALQIEAKKRKWQTLTVILQLSQWRKFNAM